MAEDEEKIKKYRVRMERDTYSVLLSFKDGATPMQLEQRMDDTLGYTYNGKYYQGGVHDMAQLLREHKQVRQLSDGKFKIVPTEEVADLVALIAKQKDGKGRRKGRGYGAKPARPMTSTGVRQSSGFVLRTSPKPFGVRPMTGLSVRSSHQKSSGFHLIRPTSSLAPVRQSSSSSSGLGGLSQARAPNPFDGPPASQRPLRQPNGTLSAPTPLPAQQSATVKEATKSSSQMPSIKEFSENSKRMMVMMHPKPVHLSELTELYNQEYGVIVDPLQLFSKSWKMLAQTTFQDWLQIIDGEVVLRDEWFKKYATAYKEQATSSKPPSSTQLSTRQSAEPTSSSELFPPKQGFQHQIPEEPSSPTDEVCNKMRCLTVSARCRTLLPTPEKPPGMRVAQRPTTPLQDLFRERPNSVVSAQKALAPAPSSGSDEASAPVGKRFAEHEYDSNNMRNLKMLEKTSEIKNRIDTALNDYPDLIPVTKKGQRRPATVNGQAPVMTSIRHTATNTTMVPLRKPTTVSSTAPTAALTLSQLQNSPTDSSLSSRATPASLSSISPPDMPPVRMRPFSSINTTPTHRLIGRALSEVKRQEHDAPVPRRFGFGTQSNSLFGPTTGTSENSLTGVKQTVIDSDDDGWGELPKVNPAAAAPVARKPMKLPPMSKGAGVGLSSRRPMSAFPSTASSRASSRARRLIDEALQSGLPDSDDW